MKGLDWAALVRAYPVSAATLAVVAVGLVVVAIVTTLPSDTASGSDSQVTAPTAAATTTASATAEATAEATESATATAVAPATPTLSAEEEALALGQQIWTKGAGGVGCEFCHGPDARGGGVSGEGAPNIRMATKSMIRGALAGGVPLMTFIKLTEPELTAVSKYLDYLSAQP